MWKYLLSVLIASEFLALSVVQGYSKVSTNGQARASSQDIAFTVSPVYVATPRTVDLRPGEAVNHPSTQQYSTLDKELVAKLDGMTGSQRAQERFHPPASFEHVLAHSNALRQQQQQSSRPVSAPSNNDVIYSKPQVSMSYDYPPSSFDVGSKPINKPATDSFPIFSPDKFPDTYSSNPANGPASQLSEYDSKPPSSFDFDSQPPKSLDFPDTYDRPFEDEPPGDIIYDHIPDDHFHHHHHHHRPTSTEPPEMMDQRLNKRPYSYYYIGKKLWYVPLYFSIYFIIYIAALVLKSIARHKINFPANLAAVAAGDGARSDGNSPGWMDYVVRVLEAVEKYGKTS